MAQTVQGWLEARRAGVPAELMERIRVAATECLGVDAVTPAGSGRDNAAGEARGDGAGSRDADEQIQAFLRVVREQLDELRHRAGNERKDALDLLAVDALMTYALEFVASVKPEALQKYAVELMRMVGGA